MLLTMRALLDNFCSHKQRSSVWCYKKAGYRTSQPASDFGGCEGATSTLCVPLEDCKDTIKSQEIYWFQKYWYCRYRLQRIE